MAGIALTPGPESHHVEFWRLQMVHQAPMLGAMVLMFTVLRSTIGLLSIVAVLGMFAMMRARAARTNLSARHFLVDAGAMALVIIVPLLNARPASVSTSVAGSMSTSGMAGTSLSGGMAVAIVLLGWAAARAALICLPAARGQRAGSLVSASCCAIGLVVMLLI